MTMLTVTTPEPFSIRLRDELVRYGTATLHEAQGQVGAMDHGIKPIDPSMRLAGPALTVAASPGDNLIVHYAVTKARAGDILVIDAQGFLEAGLWGDVLSEAAIQAGIAGVIIDGAVRDCDTICALGLPVFARGVSIKGTVKRRSGKVGTDIVCAGALVRHGDIVVGDRDGVVVVPTLDLERVCSAADSRISYEDGIRNGLRKGRTTIEMMDLAKSLESFGLK